MRRFLSVSLIGTMLGCNPGPHSPQQFLSPEIRLPSKDKYKDVRDAKDWMNPYLQACNHSVIVYLRALKPQPETVSIENVRRGLLDVAVEAWPYGRVVALQSCSIGVPGGQQAQRDEMMQLESILTSLGLTIDRWPS